MIGILQEEMEKERKDLKLKAESDLQAVRSEVQSLKTDLLTEIANQTKESLIQLQAQSKVWRCFTSASVY